MSVVAPNDLSGWEITTDIPHRWLCGDSAVVKGVAWPLKGGERWRVSVFVKAAFTMISFPCKDSFKLSYDGQRSVDRWLSVGCTMADIRLYDGHRTITSLCITSQMGVLKNTHLPTEIMLLRRLWGRIIFAAWKETAIQIIKLWESYFSKWQRGCEAE